MTLVICGHQERQGRDELSLSSCVLTVSAQQFTGVEATLFDSEGHQAPVTY